MRHDRESATSETARWGVLVVNLGTPEAPTADAVRRYLAEFLHDRRVVDLTRWLWCPVLHGFILRVRPRRVARAYAEIWTEQGSPLMVHSRALADALARELGDSVETILAMTYGQPGIDEALERFRELGIDRIVVLPLYPQYSATTTAAVFDRVARSLKRHPWLPSLRMINEYHRWPAFIDALAASVREDWAVHGEPDQLLLSFHGIPQRYHRQGDPYPLQCEATAEALMERLGWVSDRARMTYQSRFGREPWLEPYTDHVLAELGGQGCRRVDVVCPGFAADCLETLEEIAMQNRDLFVAAGGGELRYIPALNARPDHARALADRVLQEAAGWADPPGVAS